MRFYVDEDLSTEIARIGRQRGLDIVSSHEVERDGTPDDEQLDHAAA